MGIVSSRIDDGSPLFCRDQNRFAVTSIRITNSQGATLYTILPNTFPATRYTVSRESNDDSVIEYVQDPDTSNPSPNFLLRLNNDDDIYFYFTFALRKQSTSLGSATDGQSAVSSTDTNVNGLTYVFSSTPKDLETLLTREFNADPNLHRHPNVDLVGDYSTAGKQQEQFEWAWKWRPSKNADEKSGGWRSACSFVEYDQRAHRLNTLVSFSFWVHNTRKQVGTPKTLLPLPNPDFPASSRVRIPSTQSVDSRLSDSDTEAAPKDASNALSPIATIPEAGLPLELQPTNNTVKVDLNYQPLDKDMTAEEDGPVFRATMKALESKTGSMRTRMKNVLKKAEAAKQNQVASNASIAAFMEALHSASNSNANAVKPALDHYFEKIAKEILRYEVMNAENLQRLIIDPVSKLYSNDLKQAEAKKKDFEDESKDYYNYLSRYLGQRQDSTKEKKRAESDVKYQSKRKTFELKRFDYSSFMQDLHGGRKDQEVLSQLTRFADAQAKGYLETAKKIEIMLPQLEALNHEVREADKQYQLLRTGREEKRRALEKEGKGKETEQQQKTSQPIPMPNTPVAAAATLDAGMDPLYQSPPGTTSGDRLIPTDFNGIPNRPASGTAETLGVSPGTVIGNSPMAAPDKYKGIRDLESNSNGTRPEIHRKEGLLWSMSKPGGHSDPMGLNKPGWHKFWVVLDQGKLSEYINWKSQMEQHIDPIDLRMASVREARNSERRFCFEVITPHFTRIYQATGEEDMKNWIGTINNALQSAFEGRASSTPSQSASVGSNKEKGSIGKDVFGKSSSFHGHRTASGNTVPTKNVGRFASVGERPQQPPRRPSEEERSARLLQSIRNADAGNAWCADCNSESRVEWVSINLGIILCIECSGIHRSLGTHITKVRSLTLDTTSFTQDVVEILLSIGNRVSNMIWEAHLDQSSKPTPSASREQRLAFITAKYAQRSFVEPISATSSHFHSPDETLLASIKRNDIQQVLYALALAANPNATDRVRATHAVILALAASDPAAPGTTPSSSATLPAGAGEANMPRKSFPLAELLLQNGAELPSQPGPFPLSRSAQLYLEFKKQQRLGKTAATSLGNSGSFNGAFAPSVAATSGIMSSGGSGPLPSVNAATGSPGNKLQKRNSGSVPSISKLARGPGLL